MNGNKTVTVKKPLPLLLTTQQASEAWGVSQPTIRRWVREGKLRPYGGLKAWRFEFDDVRGALERV